MFYAKDRNGDFVRLPDRNILIADSWSTVAQTLDNMNVDQVEFSIHEFRIEDLLNLKESVTELHKYLSLPKFQGSGNNWVNTNDIHQRLQWLYCF